MPERKVNSLLHFHYNEPLEFISALAMAAKKDTMLELGRELRIVPDEAVMGLIDGSISRLSSHIHREMGLFFGKSLYHEGLDALLFRICYEGEEIQTAEEWLHNYRLHSPLSLVRQFAQAVYESAGMAWIDDEHLSHDTSEEEQRELLYKLAASVPLPELDTHATVLEYIRFPEEFKERTLLLLESFYRFGFLPMRQELRRQGEEGALRYERHFESDPEGAYRTIARMDASLITKLTRVHISYISQIRMDFYRIADPHQPDWMILGGGNDQLAARREEKETIEKFLKVIADKRRLDMIDLLKERKHYAGELAQLMALTPAAINYHTNLLIDLELIRITKADNRIYYELDSARLAGMMEETKAMLLG